jgi:hypothetical protein
MSTERMSSAQYTIMKALDKPMAFEQAVAFNQVIFYSLIRREWVSLDQASEKFFRNDAGDHAFHSYTNGSTKDLQVKNNDEPRQERVAMKLTGRKAKKAIAKAKKLVGRASAEAA